MTLGQFIGLCVTGFVFMAIGYLIGLQRGRRQK